MSFYFLLPVICNYFWLFHKNYSSLIIIVWVFSPPPQLSSNNSPSLSFYLQGGNKGENPAVAMAILFAVVARGTTILAKHAWCGGNFLEVTEQILAKIPSENNKLTYSHGR